jgi:hypothetical protein
MGLSPLDFANMSPAHSHLGRRPERAARARVCYANAVTRSWADRAAVAAAFLFIAALQVHRLDDGDTWWHLAAGRLIAEHGEVPATDPFSFTAAGAPWINRQWLFDLGLYGLWRIGGDQATILGAGAVFLAAFACAYRLARRRLPAWAAAVVVFLVAEAAVERFTVRPEAVTLLFLAVELLLLDGAVGWGTVAALVALQVAWANLHALSVLGLVPLGAELAGALAATWLPLPEGWRAASRRPGAEVGRIAVTAAGTMLAEAATPFGLTGAVFSVRLLTVIRGGELVSFTIVEHRATTLAELSPAAAQGLVALLALAALAAVVSLRRWRLQHVVCAAAFVALASMARRNVALLGFGVLPLLASGLGPGVAKLDGWLGSLRGVRPALACGIALFFLRETGRVVTGRYYEAAHLTRAFGLGESLVLFSSGAVDFLQAEAPAARVLNDDGLGGYLLWRAHPHRQVFIDGRLQVYPEPIYRDYQRTLDDPAAFAEVAARWGVTAVLLAHPSPGRLELAAAIARLPGWRVAYLDGGAVVLLADGRPAGQPVGVAGPAPAIATSGFATLLERAVAPWRPAAEEATARYQRGRAILTLFGRGGAAAALADFDAALRLQPDAADAAEGRRVARSLLPAGQVPGQQEPATPTR